VLTFALLSFGVDEATADMLFASQAIPFGDQRVQQYDTLTGASKTYADGFAYVQGIAFDSTSNLYVTEATVNLITKITPDGMRTTFADAGDGLNIPTYMAFDRSGNLYVSNLLGDDILRFTPDGVGSVFARTPAGSGPLGLAFDAMGNLFVANSNINTIEKFTPAGVGSTFASVGFEPEGLAFDRSGNLYVTQQFTVERFTPDGQGSTFATTLVGPAGLAFDPAGNLYVGTAGSNDHNAIMLFTPDGVGSIFADTGNYGNRDLALLASVPEPGSLVVFSTGLVCLSGVLLWKKRRGECAIRASSSAN
jgi:sugar lactone lactonase YvrE